MVQQFTRKGIPTPDPIPAGSISNGQLGDMNPWTIKMRDSDTAGPPQDRRIDDLTGEPSPDQNTLLLGMDLGGGGLVSINVNDLPSGGGGGVTGGDNVGGELGEVFKGLNNNIMEFRTLGDAGGTRMLIVTDGPNDRLTLDVNEPAVDHDNLLNYDANEHAAPKRSLTLDGGELQLIGDEDTPANAHYYGTDGAGVLGYHDASELVITPTGGVFGGTPFVEGQITQVEEVGITHKIQTIGVTGAQLSGHLGDTSIHFADAVADNNHYLRRNNAWLEGGDLALQDQIGSGQIIDGTVTNTDLANMPGWTIKLRNNGTTGPPQDVKISGLAETLVPAAGDKVMLELADGTLRFADFANFPGEANLVSSVFGRQGDVVAEADDYTWAQIDKTVSDIADITTRAHASLTGIGVNTHAQIDTHIGDGTIHFTEASIDHGSIAGLLDDDHPQYFNEARGDARYYPRTEADATFLKEIVEDTTPQLGGDLETLGQIMLFTGAASEPVGRIYNAADGGVAILYDDGTTPELTDGAVHVAPGFVKTYGASLNVDPLSHTTDGGQQVYVSENGMLFGVEPPPPQWEQETTDTGTYDLGAGAAEGPEVELTGLAMLVSGGADVQPGDRLIVQTTLYIRNATTNRSTSVQLGFGKGSNTSGWVKSQPIPPGFSGYVTVSMNTTVSVPIEDGDTVNVFARRGPGDHPQSQPIIDGALGTHEFYLAEQAAGGGGPVVEINDLESFTSGIAIDQVPVGRGPDQCQYTDTTGTQDVVRSQAPTITNPIIQTIINIQTLLSLGNDLAVESNSATRRTFFVRNAGTDKMDVQVDGLISFAGNSPANLATFTHSNLSPQSFTFPDKSGTVALLDDVGGGGLADAYATITDGVTPANASGSDEFKLRSANSILTVATQDNDATHGDNALFTVVESEISHGGISGVIADEHVAHSGVILTAGDGLSGGGDISASRTFDVAVAASVVTSGGSVQLDGDEVTPGSDHFYGTNGAGARGFYPIPAGTVEINDLRVACEGIVADQVPVGISADQCEYVGTTGANGPVVRATGPTIDGPTINVINDLQTINVSGSLLVIDAAEITDSTMFLNNTGAGRMNLTVAGDIDFFGGTPGNAAILTHLNTASRNYTFPDKSGTIALLDDIVGGDELNDLSDVCTGIAADQVPVGSAADQATYTNTTGSGDVVRASGPTLSMPTMNLIFAQSTAFFFSINSASDLLVRSSNSGAGLGGFGSDFYRVYNGPAFYSTITSLASANRSVVLPDKDGTVAFLDDIPSPGGTSVIETKSITITRAPVPGETVGMFPVPEGATVTKTWSYQLGGTSVTYNIQQGTARNGSSFGLFTADVVETSSAGATHVPDAPTIPANNWVWIEIVDVVGDVTEFHVTIEYPKAVT